MQRWITSTKWLILLLYLSSAPAFTAKLEIHVVGADSKPIENAVIYFEHFAQDEAAHTSNTTMDQQDKNFSPHLMVVPIGTQVNFSNTDTVNHYVYSFSEAKKFQFKLFKDEKNPPAIVFDQLGMVTLGCNIHDFMLGYILVVPNKYFGVTNANGISQIQIPDATHSRLHLWLERANEDLEMLSQPINIQASDISIEFKLKKPLKAERRMLHNNNDY